MSQNFNLADLTAFKFNGADCSKVMLNGVRIWERYTAQRQVWVASGYNQTVLVDQGQRFQHGGRIAYYIPKDQPSQHRITVRSGQGINGSPEGYWQVNAYKIRGAPAILWVGDWRYSRGSYASQARDGSLYYNLRVHKNVTSWVDTSSYQTQNYTAYYY
jgi:hypothetical protein